MLTIKEQEQISYWFYEQYRELEAEGLEMIANHLGAIGKLNSVDFSKLEQIAIMNGNIQDINNKLSELTGKMPSEIEKQLTAIAKEQYNDSSKFYKQNGIEQVSFADNVAVAKLLASVSSRVDDTLKNLSHTTVFAEMYRDSIDKAILAVTSGEQDFQRAMKTVIKRNSVKGFQVDPSFTDKVTYESGNRRRLDSSVRLNIMEGMHMVNQGVALITGEEFGANGVEITSHSNPAPDHIHIDGVVMTTKAYESFQRSAKRPIGELNCYHFAFPTVIDSKTGKSYNGKTAYTETTLAQRGETAQSMVDSLPRYTIGEDTLTAYEWSQQLRKLETLGRYENDLRRGAIAIDDKALASQARAKKKVYKQQYENIVEQLNEQGELFTSEWKRRAS